MREAQAAAALDHPNICTIYEVGEADGHSFIAMQYIDGETLGERLKRGPFDLPSAIALARQVAEALAEAHRLGIVHRDVKPQNIMLTRSSQAKVLDFGIAKAFGPAGTDLNTASALTGPGLVPGTTAYMSPEQARCETGRSTLRHLQLRHRPVRNGVACASLRASELRRDRIGDPDQGSGGLRYRGARRAETYPSEVSRERSRAPLSDHAGPRDRSGEPGAGPHDAVSVSVASEELTTRAVVGDRGDAGGGGGGRDVVRSIVTPALDRGLRADHQLRRFGDGSQSLP